MKIVVVSQRVDEHPARDERRDALDQAWTTLLATMGLVLVPVPNRTIDAASFANELNATALILTGGNAVPDTSSDDSAVPERDSTERRLLEWAMQKQRPLLAVCRGFQFVNRCLGGKLSAVSGHVRTLHALRWHENVHQGLREMHRVNSFHHVGIGLEDLAQDLMPMACAPDGSVEAARHREFPIWGLMWHPERSPEPAPAALDSLKQFLTGALPCER